MSQTYTDNVYQSDHVYSTDLQNMENNFAALKSRFSGSSAPSNTVAFMAWGDTTNNILKRRNNDDSGWLADLAGDSSLKIPMYRNDTCEGWVIDSSVTDRVIALKGGTQAYNASGGSTAGSWNAFDHNHKLWNYREINVNDQYYDSDGNAQDVEAQTFSGGSSVYRFQTLAWTGTAKSSFVSGSLGNDPYTSKSSHSTQRIAAALCTLQYPNL